MVKHNARQIAAMSDDELHAAIRELAAQPFSTVGDERAQYASVSQHNRPMQPYIAELVRRHPVTEDE